MTEHRISVTALHDCLRYHCAVARRRHLITLALRTETGMTEPAGLCNAVQAGLFGMADAILYNRSQKVLSETCHATPT